MTFVDADGVPTRNRSGYAIVRRTFRDEDPWIDEVENEFYFDEQGQPAALLLGQYGVHKERDEFGRNSVLTYLNANGQPMVTKAGYATVKRTFYPDDTVKTEMYYDLDGQPTALSRGQHGKLRQNGSAVLLDANGKAIFNLRNWLYANHVIFCLIALAVVTASMLLGKRGNAILLAAFAAAVVYVTLMQRPDGDSRAELELKRS